VRGSDGVVLDASGIPVSRATNDQRAPAVAWDGASYLVAWQDGRSGTNLDIYGGRVTSAGTPLDSDGFLVAGAPPDEQSVAVASSGPRSFLVLYQSFAPGSAMGATRILARSLTMNTPPTADSKSITTSEDAAVLLALTGTDADGDALSFRIVSGPSHGTLEQSGASVSYRPRADFSGGDGFTYVCSDGLVESVAATISIAVTPVNDAPVAESQSRSAGATLEVVLAATDVDGDALSYTIETPPIHGTLSAGSGPNRTYTPSRGFTGQDSFTFVASDGLLGSAPATVTIEVTDPNLGPMADSQSVSLEAGASRAVTLAATDPDGDPLTYTIVTPPAHGTLAGSGASRTYTPGVGYSGPDRFTFTASDGLLDSNEAAVSITVTPAPQESPPSGGCSCGTIGEAGPLGALLTLAVLRPRHRRRAAGGHRGSRR
jgi:hypothetical protein